MIMGACLPDDMFLALAEGALAVKALDAAQTHLDSCPKCRRLLVAVSGARTASRPTADVSGGSGGAERIELPVGHGTAIGRYLVTGIVGAGGMGAVYAAHDPELERQVAIKLLHPGVDQPGERLRREARAMARLVHPNVVQVYDLGAHGGRTFMAMELVEGRTLRSWLQESPRAGPEIVAAFVEAGRGLSAAHEAGLVHGDFKPDNVFVSGDGRVKVGDFGLSRPLQPGEAPVRARRGGQTLSGTAGGTPSYLAPEVVAGRAPSAASDQFSFCVSLWEGLHGQRPFSGATALVLLREARAGRVQPESSRRVPAWLRRVVLRGLAADPAARHPSMSALLHALAEEPVQRNPPSRPPIRLVAFPGGGSRGCSRRAGSAGAG